jgi:hypothetical protein
MELGLELELELELELGPGAFLSLIAITPSRAVREMVKSPRSLGQSHGIGIGIGRLHNGQLSLWSWLRICESAVCISRHPCALTARASSHRTHRAHRSYGERGGVVS